ncbi:MAG: hypothetical protein ACE5R6_17935 [Candidatus Heimdallarchaeota archaeon]
MQKIYALIEDIDPKKIKEEPTGILIDDGVRTLHLGERIVRGRRRTGKPSTWPIRGVGFLSKLWDRKKAADWLDEHTPNLGVQYWLEFETDD